MSCNRWFLKTCSLSCLMMAFTTVDSFIFKSFYVCKFHPGWCVCIVSTTVYSFVNSCELFSHILHSSWLFTWYWQIAWWRHQMETFSALLANCAGNSPVSKCHKGQWRRALMFSLICVWINGWVNNGETGDLRRYRAHYDVTVMVRSPQFQISKLEGCR